MQGTYSFTQSGYTYEGTFCNGFLKNTICTINGIEIKRGMFEIRGPDIILLHGIKRHLGSIYTGTFDQYERLSTGSITTPDGIIYIGDFEYAERQEKIIHPTDTGMLLIDKILNNTPELEAKIAHEEHEDYIICVCAKGIYEIKNCVLINFEIEIEQRQITYCNIRSIEGDVNKIASKTMVKLMCAHSPMLRYSQDLIILYNNRFLGKTLREIAMQIQNGIISQNYTEFILLNVLETTLKLIEFNPEYFRKS